MSDFEDAVSGESDLQRAQGRIQEKLFPESAETDSANQSSFESGQDGEPDWSDPKIHAQLAEEFHNSHYGEWTKDLREKITDYGVSNVSELVRKMQAEGDQEGAELAAHRYQTLMTLQKNATEKMTEASTRKLHKRIPALRDKATQAAFKDHLIDKRGWSEQDISAAFFYRPELLEDAYSAWRNRKGSGRRLSLPKKRRPRFVEADEVMPTLTGRIPPTIPSGRDDGLTVLEAAGIIEKRLFPNKR